MTANEFWLGVLSNSLATLIAGTILGSIGALIIYRISRAEEKKSLDLENKIIKINKTLDFLKTIQLEIVDIIINLEIIKPKIKTLGDRQYIDLLPYVNFDTSFWEILKSSGEIPSLFEPIVIQVLTNFYSMTSKCNLLYGHYLSSQINDNNFMTPFFHSELVKSMQSLENISKSPSIELMLSEVIDKATQTKVQLENGNG